MTNANLEKAEFPRATLEQATLKGANLTGSDLARTIFAKAKVEGAKFTNARMFRARLEGIDLSSAQGLTQPQLDSACGDSLTKLPAGLKPGPAWPCAQE